MRKIAAWAVIALFGIVVWPLGLVIGLIWIFAWAMNELNPESEEQKHG